MFMATKNRNRRLEAGLHLGIWGLLVLVHALVFTRYLPFEISLLRGVLNVLPMAFLFYINLGLVRRFLDNKQYTSYGIIIGGLFILLTVVRMEINLLFPEMPRDVIFINEARSWAIGAALTNLSTLLISLFYQILYSRIEQDRRNLAIIHKQQEAQLQFLRAQINPHFLFNTLHNIYSLAVIKSDKTAAMVLKLSNLLRYVVYDSKAEQVPLRREVTQMEQFIALFQMRSEQPLDLVFVVNGDVNNVQIEPMILIPLVENCFKHCDFDTNERAFVKIELQITKDTLYFHTLNSKNEQDMQRDQVGGVGLENIRKRLELRYQGHYFLKITDDSNVFAVHLKIILPHEND